MSRARTSWAVTLAVTAVFLVATGADARPWVPAELQRLVGTPCVPACTLCHDSLEPQSFPTTPFGHEVLNAGFAPSARETDVGDGKLACVLKNLDPSLVVEPSLLALGGCGGAESGADAGVAAPTSGDGLGDSTKDGVNDVQQLQAGIDPNGGGGSTCGPTYGCLRVAPRGHVDGVAGFAGAVALVAGIGVVRRRRRR